MSCPGTGKPRPPLPPFPSQPKPRSQLDSTWEGHLPSCCTPKELISLSTKLSEPTKVLRSCLPQRCQFDAPWPSMEGQRQNCPHTTQRLDTGKYLSLWWHRWGCDHLYLRGSGKRLTLKQEFTRKMRMLSQRNGRHCGAGALCVRGHRCWGGFFFPFPSELSTERCLPDSSIKGLQFLAFYSIDTLDSTNCFKNKAKTPHRLSRPTTELNIPRSELRNP